MDFEKLATGILNGDLRALAKSITLVENRKSGYMEIFKALRNPRVKSLKIGISGAPGSGKSTLIDRIIERLRAKNHSIGVIAVDPTSPLSGGALMIDRIKMDRFANDPQVFIRSVASRGMLGGLNPSIFEIVRLMEAFSKDFIIIETVGVGQNEVDIANIADIVALILTPFSGDEMQIFKAGIIEIADLFVINKMDLGGAEKKELEITNYFALSDSVPKIVKTSAVKGLGIDEMIGHILSLYRSSNKSLPNKKNKLNQDLIIKIIQERVGKKILSDSSLVSFLNQKDKDNPWEIADKIIKILFSGGWDDKKD